MVVSILSTLVSLPKLGYRANVEAVKTFAQPTVVLISSRVDESVDQHLDPEGRSRNTGDNDGLYVHRVDINLITLASAILSTIYPRYAPFK